MSLAAKVMFGGAVFVIASAATSVPLERFTAAQRSAFRALVEQYQVAVVPRCTPDVVLDYNLANADRDAAFVRSLKGTPLLADYEKAVATSAEKDRRTVYHCFGPPPPPPTAAVVAPEVPENGRQKHFTNADKLFAELVASRDAAMAARRK